MSRTHRLRGCRVLVTRPGHQSAGLQNAIESEGGHALLLPTIEIRPKESPEALTAMLRQIGDCHLLLFISPNAVKWGVPGLRDAGLLAAQARIAAVGQTTATALEVAGVPVDIVPARGADSEALLAHPELQEMAGRRVLIVRGEGGRELLADTLRERGAEVYYAEVYRRAVPERGGAQIKGWLAGGDIDVVTATSAAGLQNLVQLTPREAANGLYRLPLVVVSKRMLQLAAALGFTGPIEVAAGAGDTAITEAVSALWASHPHPN